MDVDVLRPFCDFTLSSKVALLKTGINIFECCCFVTLDAAKPNTLGL